jgi:hypothetical protein
VVGSDGGRLWDGRRALGRRPNLPAVGGFVHGGLAVGVGMGMIVLGGLGVIGGGYMIYKSGCIPGI